MNKDLHKIEEIAVKQIKDICIGDKFSNRKAILEYEKFARELNQVEIPVKHYVHGGMYAREIVIPKGVILTGQIYKFDHFDVMVSGDITVSTDDGECKRLTGYNCFTGFSGKKRAGFAHEDTTWITFHPFINGVGFEDPESIQAYLTVGSFSELDCFNSAINKADFLHMLDELQLSKDLVRQQSENKADQIEMPIGFEHVYIDKSSIEGSGVFSSKAINASDEICPARINGKRTPAGRYANHAVTNNSDIIIKESGIAMLIANRRIEKGEEITVNYRKVIEERSLKGDLCQV